MNGIGLGAVSLWLAWVALGVGLCGCTKKIKKFFKTGGRGGNLFGSSSLCLFDRNDGVCLKNRQLVELLKK